MILFIVLSHFEWKPTIYCTASPFSCKYNMTWLNVMKAVVSWGFICKWMHLTRVHAFNFLSSWKIMKILKMLHCCFHISFCQYIITTFTFRLVINSTQYWLEYAWEHWPRTTYSTAQTVLSYIIICWKCSSKETNPDVDPAAAVQYLHATALSLSESVNQPED